jgi:hypothetical protein
MFCSSKNCTDQAKRILASARRRGTVRPVGSAVSKPPTHIRRLIAGLPTSASGTDPLESVFVDVRDILSELARSMIDDDEVMVTGAHRHVTVLSGPPRSYLHCFLWPNNGYMVSS